MLFVFLVASMDIKLILVTYLDLVLVMFMKKMKWIPKYVNANILGPKQVWVPKDQT